MKILMAEHTHYDSASQVGCHLLAQHFSRKGHEVTYLSTVLTPLHVGQLFTAKRVEAAKRFKNWALGGTQWEERLFTYVPLSLLPYARKPFLDAEWISRRQIAWTIPNLWKKIRPRGPFDVLIMGEPRFVPLMDYVKAPVNILRLTDDVMEFKDTPRSVESLLRSAADQCDHVIATSSPLRDKLRVTLEREDVIYMPNGVEYGHFARAHYEEPEDLALIQKPRALYVGAIREWFDWDCVAYCARQLPEVSFVLIGPSLLNLKFLAQGLPNVHYLGPRPYAQVPYYMASAQVGIIPFKREERTDSVSSIKLLQYLAAGLPTVSARWKELERLNPPVRLAEDPMEFADAIRETIKEKNVPGPLQAFARERSWEKNVDQILELASKRGEKRRLVGLSG